MLLLLNLEFPSYENTNSFGTKEEKREEILCSYPKDYKCRKKG